MLSAARASLFEGRYGEAIAAYQAVLKRDPKNVDALTHLGLIVAIGGHADTALETLERALAIDPEYPPALLYRGQVLYESKKDTAGAIRSWEKFVAVMPPGATSINIVYYDVSVHPRDQVNFSEVQVQSTQKIVQVNGVSVSKDLGFVKGHKYEVVATRVIGKKEKVYAKGTVTLK